MFTWEVIFKPHESIDGKAANRAGGDLRVEFVAGKGGDFETQSLGGGGTRVKFYGTLKIKSIPGGSANGSYEIPSFGKKSS
ncbi:MAG TPA: hypothetical protein VIF83_07050 [Gemmatimonadaceae bacterium]